MPQVTITIKAPDYKSRTIGTLAISRTVEIPNLLPIGSAHAFSLPFAEDEAEGAEIIHVNGCIVAELLEYLGVEKNGIVECHATLQAKGITPEQFQDIPKTRWFSRFGWMVTESSIKDIRI